MGNPRKRKSTVGRGNGQPPGRTNGPQEEGMDNSLEGEWKTLSRNKEPLEEGINHLGSGNQGQQERESIT